MRIAWDKAGEHIYETGVDHGVLFVGTGGSYGNGVPWNGLTAVNESPSGAESNANYADNIKYLNLISAEDFGCTIEAFTYPPEFEICDGSAEIAPGVLIGQQNRRPFGFCYRTLIGNDLDGQDHGYKLHLIYGCTASPSERSYGTVNDSPEPISFSWEVATTPVDVPGFKPTASLTINSLNATKHSLKKLEDILYGTASAESRLPMPEEVMAIMNEPDPVVITTSAPGNSVDLLGKTASDLQEGIEIRANDITGKLKYVSDYTDFSSNPVEREGHYLALKIDTVPENAKTTVQLLGGTSGAKELDDDHLIVLRVTNVLSQSVQIVSTVGEDSAVKNYSLSSMTLLPKEAGVG